MVRKILHSELFVLRQLYQRACERKIMFRQHH